MTDNMRFSDRHGFSQSNESKITVRHEAPHEFRGVLVELAYECGFKPKSLRTLVCRTLRKRPDSSNWSEYPNVDEEVRRLIDDAEWYKVYDLVEAIINTMFQAPYVYNSDLFISELNVYFVEKGIGWKLVGGKIEARSPETLEQTIHLATTTLHDAGSKTAQAELHEALADLSRRPDPDITGAVQHAMAALECVARDVTGNEKATLGDILKRHPNIAPPPLNLALEKLWGFASEYGRHVREGRNPEFMEAQLVVGTCAAMVNYLVNLKNV